MKSVALGFVMVLTLVAIAAAQPLSVGPTCTASWLAPTTGVDGLPLQSPVTSYRVYVDKGAITPGVTVPTATVTGLTWACGALVPGAHVITVSAVNAGGEGPAAVPLAFVLVLAAPGSPSGLKVQ